MPMGAARSLGRLLTLPADPKTLLKGPLGFDKRVAWSERLALDDIKRVARGAGATVNDVLVATAAGALGRYLARRGENVEGLELHAMVPVNLRESTTPPALGNRFGLVLLGLPVGMTEPFARVAAVKARMDSLKATPEAGVTHALLRAMGHLPRSVEELGVTFFGKKASLVLTNVPGPRARVKLAGVPVSRIMFWVPQSGRMGLGISIFSYAGEVTVGILSDAALVPDPETLAGDLYAELAALEA
jgi:WS/DGAT/MGAT family acyltransferase